MPLTRRRFVPSAALSAAALSLPSFAQAATPVLHLSLRRMIKYLVLLLIMPAAYRGCDGRRHGTARRGALAPA